MKVLVLTEALDSEEKSQVDTWEAPHHHFSDHAFDSEGEGKYRTIVPLEHPNTSKHYPEIEEHLKKHGYKIHNYIEGRAEDKHGRMTTIGRALTKTKNPELLAKFSSDPARQQKAAQSDYHVVISRHPHDVAGMTSHNHSWYNESCMNFNTGGHRHKLKSDVKHGTHVAYLVHKDDKDIEKPVARIALKPMKGEFTGDKILRAEGKTYGNAPDAFSHTVNKWVNKHFPGEDDHYKIHSKVYNDSGISSVFGAKALDKMVDSLVKNPHKIDDLNTEEVDAIFAHPNLTKQHISRLMDARRPEIDVTLGLRSTLHPEHIDRALSEKTKNILSGIHRQPNVTSAQLRKIADVGNETADSNLVFKALGHPSVRDDDLDHIVDHAVTAIHAGGAPYHADYLQGNIKPHHVEKIYHALRDKGEHVGDVVGHHRMPSHLLDSIVHDNSITGPSPYVLAVAAGHPNLSHDGMAAALDHPSHIVRSSALHNPALPDHLISDAINKHSHDYDGDDRFSPSIWTDFHSHPNLKEHHITALMGKLGYMQSYEDTSRVQYLLNHSKTTDTHRMMAMHWAVADDKQPDSSSVARVLDATGTKMPSAGLGMAIDHITSKFDEKMRTGARHTDLHRIVLPTAYRVANNDNATSSQIEKLHGLLKRVPEYHDNPYESHTHLTMIAKHPNTPKAIVRELWAHPDGFVHEAAAARIRHEEQKAGQS